MRRIRLLLVAVLASSAIVAAAAPAQARCRPELAAVCRAIVLVCDVTGRSCAA